MKHILHTDHRSLCRMGTKKADKLLSCMSTKKAKLPYCMGTKKAKLPYCMGTKKADKLPYCVGTKKADKLPYCVGTKKADKLPYCVGTKKADKLPYWHGKHRPGVYNGRARSDKLGFSSNEIVKLCNLLSQEDRFRHRGRKQGLIHPFQRLSLANRMWYTKQTSHS